MTRAKRVKQSTAKPAPHSPTDKAEPELRSFQGGDLSIARVEALVERVLAWGPHRPTEEEKIQALIELLAGLEDDTGTNTQKAYFMLRARMRAFTLSKEFQNCLADFAVKHCGARYS